VGHTPLLAPRVAVAALAALVALGGVGACSSGDDGADDEARAGGNTRGCPLAAEAVAEEVGHPVDVDRRPAGARSCAYTGAGDAAGARVEVALRSLDGEDGGGDDGDDGYEAALAEAQRQAGPTAALPESLVDGAERGWVATAGRAVQVGAADEERLVIVAVVDPRLDADAAREVAGRLAGEALDG
jgi:hypothetical protein